MKLGNKFGRLASQDGSVLASFEPYREHERSGTRSPPLTWEKLLGFDNVWLGSAGPNQIWFVKQTAQLESKSEADKTGLGTRPEIT
jgi:hypothetical protein